MAPNRVEVLDTTYLKTYEWLHDISQELGDDSRRHAYMALRGTLHALRDFLPLHESAQFAAQLPMLLRGLYFEGWDPATAPDRDRSLEQFLNRITHGLDRDPWQDGSPIDAETAARAVLCVTARRISDGEMDHMRGVMPERIQRLWPLVSLAD